MDMRLRAITERWRGHTRDLRYGFLLVPGTLAVCLVVLGAALSTFERHAGTRGYDLIFTGGPAAARSILTVLGEGIATVLGISFSITIVALQLVSQQFSPRALRGFLGDRITQVMTGLFVGTFGYSLTVLRVIRGSAGSRDSFTPTVSVAVGILLGLVCLGVLIVFFHHMARRVQAEEIAADVARETLDSVDVMYPDTFGDSVPEDPDRLLAGWWRDGAPDPVYPPRPGYVQRIVVHDLPELLKGRCRRVHVKVAPGDFVTPAMAMAEVWVDDDSAGVADAVRAAVVIGSVRDVDQDTPYGVRQLSDIAVKAISPAINDPTTAWTAIHYIKSIVERVAARDLPAEVRRHGEEHGDGLLLIGRRPSFEEYVDIGFVQIGRYAARDARVAGGLLEGLIDVARAARAAGAEDRLGSLLSAGRGIAVPAIEAALTDRDRDHLRDLLLRLEGVVEQTRSGTAVSGSGSGGAHRAAAPAAAGQHR